MTLLEEQLFERLAARYARRFGTAPDFTAGTVEEAIALLRRALDGPPPARPPTRTERDDRRAA